MSGTGSNVWHRNPLVWMLIAFPAWSVVAGIGTVIVAFRVFDGVVVDDYYAQGKAINVTIERDVAAERRGLAALATITAVLPAKGSALRNGVEAPGIEVIVTGIDVASLPATLKLAILHSTRGGLDAHVALTRSAIGIYRAELPPLAPGKYYLQIEAEDWRIVGALRRPTENTTSLGPAR